MCVCVNLDPHDFRIGEIDFTEIQGDKRLQSSLSVYY